MKSALKLLCLTPLALALVACGDRVINGDGKISTSTRTTVGFNTIAVSGNYQVQILNGTMPMVQVSADENLLSSISTDSQNKVLSIHGPEDVDLKPTQPIVVKVTVTNLQNLTTSGSSIVTADKLSGQDLNINMSGSSTADVNHVIGDNMHVKLTGDSHLKMLGQIKNLNLTASGNTTAEAKNLISQQATLDLSGNSNVSIAAQQLLQIKASGNTKLTYYGNPKTLKQEISGAASVTQVPLLKLSKPAAAPKKTAKTVAPAKAVTPTKVTS